jgi:hypothetical protein
MFERFKVRRALRDMPSVQALVVENVPQNRLAAVISHFQGQGWTHVKSEVMAYAGNMALYRVYFLRELRDAANLRSEISRRLLPPD